MTATYKKALLASAILLALSGADVFAEAPQMTGSQNGMSQSSMIDVKSGKEAGKTGEISDQTEKAEPSMEVKESHQTVAVGDASLYLSADDDAAIEAHTGKTIAHVDFDGIPEEVKTKLSPLLQSKPGSTVTAEGIRNDVASLGSTGVFSQIRPNFKEIHEGVDLTYGLVANPIVRDVEFTGNTIFTSDYLKSILQVPEGSVLNFVLVNQKLKEIEDAYLKQGYMLVSIPNVEVTPKGILKVHISEGVIEDIQLVGNDKTKDKVILRELKMKKGKPFNKFQASRSMERLYNLGYFEDVNMKLLPGKENEHNVVIEIDVVEQKTGVITVGAGYSDSDGTVGIIELGDTNFRGTGDKVNFHWEFGGAGDGKNYTISYTRPWINSNGDSLGASIFNRIYEYDDYDSNGDTVAEYDKRRSGWNLTWGRQNGEYRTNYFTFESAKEKYDDHDGFEWGSAATDRFKNYNKEGYSSEDEMKKLGVALSMIISVPRTASPSRTSSITAITTSMPARAAAFPSLPSGADMALAVTMISTSSRQKAASTKASAMVTSLRSVCRAATLTVTFPTEISSISAARIPFAAMKMTSSRARKCTRRHWNIVSRSPRKCRASSSPMAAALGASIMDRSRGMKMMMASSGLAA